MFGCEEAGSERREVIDRDRVTMTDDAQNEHVGEKEEPCSEPTFEKGRSCCLAVEADGHNIE